MTNATYVQTVLSQNFMPIRDGLSQAELATQLTDIVEQLLTSGVKTVSVIGGAASGKSTVAEELVDCLQKNGTKTDMLCTDNYAAGDREYRQVEIKEADARKRYNFKLMDEHIAAIRALKDNNGTIATPVIDSKTGIAADADPADYSHEVSKLDVLIIEGDFPREDYDIRFFVHVPDKERLENNIERAAENDDDIDTGKLTQAFNDRQRVLHKPHTLPALVDADYVLEADTSQDEWSYTLYQKKRDA